MCRAIAWSERQINARNLACSELSRMEDVSSLSFSETVYRTHNYNLPLRSVEIMLCQQFMVMIHPTNGH